MSSFFAKKYENCRGFSASDSQKFKNAIANKSLSCYNILCKLLSEAHHDNRVNSWSRDALSWANAEGLITGSTEKDGVTRLKPQDNATREQVAAILMRFCEKFGI